MALPLPLLLLSNKKYILKKYDTYRCIYVSIYIQKCPNETRCYIDVFFNVFLSTCGSWSSKHNSQYLHYKSESYMLCVGKHMHDVKCHSRPRSLSLAFFNQLFSSKQLQQSSAYVKKNMIAEAAMYYHITFFHCEKPKYVFCF